MAKIEVEPKSLFGYGLIVFGIILLIFTFIQATITISDLTAVMSKVMPNPTLAFYRQEATELPGFAESLSWFFMLLIQTLIGFFIATIGIRLTKK